MKSELLYHNSVNGIYCCIGDDHAQPIREAFNCLCMQSSRRCRHVPPIHLYLSVKLWHHIPEYRSFKNGHYKNPELSFSEQLLPFFLNSKVKVQQLNSETFHVLFPFQVLFKDKVNVACKLIRYALCSFQLGGYLLNLCRTRFQESSFYGNISAYILNAMVPDSVTVETLYVTT